MLLSRSRPGDAGISGFASDAYTQWDIQNARVTAIGESGTWEVISAEPGDYLLSNLAPGEYLLQVEAEGYSATLLPEAGQITTFVWPALCPLTGMAENPEEQSINPALAVSPNPSTGSAVIRRQSPLAGPVPIQVVDRCGRLMRAWSVRQSAEVK